MKGLEVPRTGPYGSCAINAEQPAGERPDMVITREPCSERPVGEGDLFHHSGLTMEDNGPMWPRGPYADPRAGI